MTVIPGLPPSGGTNLSTKHCHHCHYEPTPDVVDLDSTDGRLMTCRGCLRALYCSQQCQTEAWPSHKEICRQQEATPDIVPAFDDEALSIGFSSGRHLEEVLRAFESAHWHAIKSLAKAAVLREGGIPFTQRTQRLLELRFQRTLSLGSGSNPSRAFKYKSHAFTTLPRLIASNPSFAHDWAHMQPARDSAQEDWEPFVELGFAGLLPLRISVDGVNYARIHLIALFHPKEEAGAPDIALVRDMFTFMTDSINRGFPLRQVDEQPAAISMPGHRTHSPRAGWTWRARFTSWEDYQVGEHKGLDAALRKVFGADRTPQRAMELFYNW